MASDENSEFNQIIDPAPEPQLCPLCSEFVGDDEAYRVEAAHGRLYLMHGLCAETALEEYEQRLDVDLAADADELRW